MENPSPATAYSLLNQLTFYAFLASGAFIVLLWGPNVLGNHVSPLTQDIIFIFPWLMLWLSYAWKTITNRRHRREILCMVAIILLGKLNIVWSDSYWNSLPQMRVFLLTGILTLWVSMFLITDLNRRRVFDWFCCACLAIIVPLELITRVVHGSQGPGVFEVFTLNPIPLGTLLMLLSPGALRLLLSPQFKVKIWGGLLLCLLVALIISTAKRGSLLAVMAMALALLFLRGGRLRYLACTVVLVIGLLVVFQGRRLLASLDPNIPSQFTILHRLELYPFAMHIWQHHPVMGMGLRSFTHQNYLVDYQQHNHQLQDFPKTVSDLQTFDNMILTGFAELGTVMTLLYLVLVIFIIIRYYHAMRVSPEPTVLDWYRLVILLGFAIHSLTYDSLLFPPVNWLFHAQLGIMAAYLVPGNATGSAASPVLVGS
jgi:O-antigen ligase